MKCFRFLFTLFQAFLRVFVRALIFEPILIALLFPLPPFSFLKEKCGLLAFVCDLVLREPTSRLEIESFAADLTVPHAGSFYQKRGLAHHIEDDLSPREHVSRALSFGFPLSFDAKLPADVQQASSYISSSHPDDVRFAWELALQKLRERSAELECQRRRELEGVVSSCKPFAAKVHLPLLRETLRDLGVGGGEWIDQFFLGFPLVGTVSEEGVYPLKGDPPPPIPVDLLLEGAPERCRKRMSSRCSPHDDQLWREALAQEKKGWLEGPFDISVDAVVTRGDSQFRCNPAFRFGVLQGEKLRAVDDLKQSYTNAAAQVLTPINLPTWDHFSSLIKLMTKLAPSLPLGFAKADHSDAYKQLPLRPDHRGLAAITLREPSSGRWRCFLPNTQVFGSTTAVLQYNCLSRVIATLARRLLKIPVMGYFDDFGIVDPLSLTKEALQAFTELNRILGSISESRNQSGTRFWNFWGLR